MVYGCACCLQVGAALLGCRQAASEGLCMGTARCLRLLVTQNSPSGDGGGSISLSGDPQWQEPRVTLVTEAAGVCCGAATLIRLLDY